MADGQSFGERYRARWHRVGLLWNRLAGTFLVVVGGLGLALSLGSESFSPRTHWPTFVAVAGIWLLARYFFKARDVVIEPVDGEGHPGEKAVYPLEWLDRGLGTGFSRLAGTIAALGGIWAAWSVLSLEDFTFGGYWPVLAMSTALIGVAVLCFRARPSFLDMMSETPLVPSEAAARRRDRAVDHESRGRDQYRADAQHREERH